MGRGREDQGGAQPPFLALSGSQAVSQPHCISLLECQPLESKHRCSPWFTVVPSAQNVETRHPVGAQSVESPAAVKGQRSAGLLSTVSLHQQISSLGV